ncbi:hypothetical protein [Azospirillum argentinense]
MHRDCPKFYLNRNQIPQDTGQFPSRRLRLKPGFKLHHLG